jgi:hypothetical protein
MPYILCCGYALTQLRGMSRQTKSAFFTQVRRRLILRSRLPFVSSLASGIWRFQSP